MIFAVRGIVGCRGVQVAVQSAGVLTVEEEVIMLRKCVLAVMVGIFVCLPLAAVKAELIHYPTEVTYYDSAKAYNGVNLFTPSGGVSYLVDMDGRLVHKWKSLGYSKILENGNLLTTGMLKGVAVIAEENWFGNYVWSKPDSFATMPASFSGKMVTWTGASMHHDMNRIWNKQLKAYTYLMNSSFQRTKQQAIDLGASVSTAYASGWYDDGMVEIDRTGQIVWMWTFADHLCQTNDSTLPHYTTDLSTLPGKLDISVQAFSGTTGAYFTAPTRDWTHTNSINYNPDNGYVTINSRAMNEFYVINHDATFVSTTDFSLNAAAAAGTAGDFIYRFGCPSNYNAGAHPAWGTNGNQQLWGAHNIQWIPTTFYPKGPTLPGASNFLIFDNHSTNSMPFANGSQLLEINPRVTGAPTNGAWPSGVAYVSPPSAGYVTGTPLGMCTAPPNSYNFSNQIVWKYQAQFGSQFSSPYISSVGRLPNGNTTGDAGAQGHFFEVTSTGQMVWEYANPISNGKAYKFQYDPGMSTFSVFRFHRYSAQQPGLSNRLIQYSDGSIQPIMKQAGVGFTLTGQVPCRSVPCAYVGAP
jgi:hypothetical protein